MNENDKLPCLNCITLAICKSRILSGDSDGAQYQNTCQTIYTICPLAKDYTSTNEHGDHDWGRVKEMYKYMRGDQH